MNEIWRKQKISHEILVLCGKNKERLPLGASPFFNL
jgi:hypothetical protein